MDQEVAKTLGELELKLQQLEHELTSIGHQDEPVEVAHAPTTAPAGGAQAPPYAPGKLVDEAIEPSAFEQASLDSDGFGGPPVFGGEEVPAMAGGTAAQDWKTDVRETAYGEIPTPPAPPTPSPGPSPGPPIPPPAPQPPPSSPPGPPSPATPPTPTPQPEQQPIDVAELMRFKQKMRRTLDELIDEYSRLLPPDRPYGPSA